MSIEIKLGISALAVETPGAQQIAQRIASDIVAPFAAASDEDIVLQPFLSDAHADGTLGGPVSAGQLHMALESITGYQRRRNRVTNIGLLIADTYEPAPGHFGMMFDENFEPGSSDWTATTPREGCAVFLGAIAGKRNGADFDAEVIYTAIHELGHVFNLQHAAPPSYMAQSAGEPQPFVNAKFTEHSARLLAQCSTSCYIWPGGSKFGDLGELAPGLNDISSANAPPDLRLSIGLDRREFWRFEPVELDVELSLRARSNRRAPSVPDALDPGYERFVIWIEEPDGERRRYRSPRHYCDQHARVSVSRSNPMRRDISIFGESGRFTFRKVGRHRLFASFATAGARTVNSNVLEVNILAPDAADSVYVHGHAVFADRDLAKLMYHRRLTPRRRRKITRLMDFTAQHRQHPSAALAHYAIGRALASYVRQAQRAGAPTAQLKRASLEHLRAAATHRHLGDHRKWRAEEALGALGS